MEKKKILERPFWASWVIPILVVLLAFFIVWGMTRILSVKRTYKDLLTELNSKTFGNRWVAAYELSKILATKQIPQEEIPGVVNELTSLYQLTEDGRARHFIILAAGSLVSPVATPLLLKALEDRDLQVEWAALVGLANLPKKTSLDWTPVKNLMAVTSDSALLMAASLALASHQVAPSRDWILPLLNHPDEEVQDTAARALIAFHETKAIPHLQKILSQPSGKHSVKYLTESKLSIMEMLEKYRWDALNQVVEETLLKDPDQKVVLQAKELLILLKK